MCINMKTKILFGLVLLGLVLISGCGQYSSGDRVGTVNKFSEKGLFSKTWEGQMLLGGLKQTGEGYEANIFSFSIDKYSKHGENKDDLVSKITECLNSGKRCKLHYEEEIISSPFRSDTSYFITEVEILENEN